ncbi:laminin subunit alpha-like [Watersipora subatra]|uniref:laminin subunit alpha-like n=1 Tax=Watersipora subatra TaxID=2589382 RepID=UPI00355AD777
MGIIPKTLLALAIITSVIGQEQRILTPPYFNLATGSSISATDTCGVDIAFPREIFCRLTGASADEIQETYDESYYTGDSVIIAGQLCHFCYDEGDVDSNSKTSQIHPARYAIDGSEKWWQSPPLSRGAMFNEVNLTVDLGQEFHVAYVFIQMGNSPRPGVWALERSTDNGKTWSPWQYFADSRADCQLFFQQPASKKPTTDDEVICTTEFSKIVPLEGGEIIVSLVQDRPGATDFWNSPVLQEFTKATSVRLRLLRTKTLQGHLMQLQAQDPTVTRRYFYSVKDISIGGRCVCNGHADACDKNNEFKRACECKHNTCGNNCDRCCEPYVQKKWRPASIDSSNECEPCQCFGHATDCVYSQQVDDQGRSVDIYGNYEGGGVCQNCTDNTEGINCDQCVHGFFRPLGKSLYDKDVCQKCDCSPEYTTGDCEDETGTCKCLERYTGPTCQECAFGYYGAPECLECDCFLNGTIPSPRPQCLIDSSGQCQCRENFAGIYCNECAPGYWNFPECIPCSCGGEGVETDVCDQKTGQCDCEFSFTGMECDQCTVGNYDYPNCTFCNCDRTGTVDSVCDQRSGQCICQENYMGERCDKCADNFFSYPECKECQCDVTGTVDGSTTCNQQGQCRCLANFGGLKCGSCAPGYYNYPNCKSCDCDQLGSYGRTCDQDSAQCNCRPNFEGLKCSSCAPDYYNFPTCEACLCNPAGAMQVEGFPLGGCGSFADGIKLCECKKNVEGHICDQCKPGFYNLATDNPDGCQPCSCYLPGTLLGDNMCDPVTGQCLCKVNVNSEFCQECVAGTYNLQESNVFGCEDCDCDMGGSVSGVCNVDSGNCICRPQITGRACNKPLNLNYFPTLHQFKYELEDGFNPNDEDSAVRFGFKESDFPDFSWRGYAIFSRIQPEVRVTTDIKTSSFFKLIFRYMNRNFETITAKVFVAPDDPAEEEQEITVDFPVTGSFDPDFVTTDTELVLSPGKWTISVMTDSNLEVRSDHIFVDYLVLLPQAYYEGGVLQDKLRNPCMVPSDGRDCLHYTYLDLSEFNQLNGGDAIAENGTDIMMETNRDILLPLNSPELALLNDDQSELVFDMVLKDTGKYVFVVGYTSPMARVQMVTVSMKPQGENATVGMAMLYECEYSSLCRQVVIDMEGSQQILDTPTVNVTVSIMTDPNTYASIGYIAAVPESEWKDEIVKAEVMCVQVNGKCIESSYRFLPGSIKMDVEGESNVSAVTGPNGQTLVRLDTSNVLEVNFSNVPSQSYAIVARYYQTDDMGFPVNITVDVKGVMYTGYFEAPYCPNTAGCNSIITFDKIPIKNQIIEVLSPDVTVRVQPLESEGVDMLMEFIQMVPTKDVKTLLPSFEMLNPHDLSARYISECTNEDFYINPEKGQITPFCRSSIFSVTTDYNNGALPCECDAQGSNSFQCSEFGGQCRCKPNVIGRTCNACAQNYWGFPDCKPCDCPAATCNPDTGNCECPKKVVGDNCDQCANQTFGYDPIIGCMDCNCKLAGVLNGNLNCDTDLGYCDCKPNVWGRTCDSCMNGFWNYPSCDACNCDPAGTTEIVCNQDTSVCSCKANTGGDTCGECQSGTYNLETRNTKGCTKCFCFGITSTCQSSSLLRSQILNMSDWTLNIDGNMTNISISKDFAVADLAMDDSVQKTALYWVAPEAYLGNKLTSYGGQIKFTVSNDGAGRDDRPSKEVLAGPAIQITGKGTTMVYLMSPILDEEIAVDLIESSWRHAESGETVTREQMMKALSSIDELLIKANHYSDIPQVTLSSVSLDSAVSLDTNISSNSTGVSESFPVDIALSVEQCSCPSNYAGTSCEDCADGFYRKTGDQGDFVCIPCACNGHSETCDKETGVCSGCRGNTEGDHCELCKFGYTGEPELEDCTICACPMPIESNNFASSCVRSPIDKIQTMQCDCMPGYMPPYCGSCGPGYYGDPRNTSGGACLPCNCNGNIDTSDPDSCDSITGRCEKCLNNTQGDNCEQCGDFYWGDAIDAKDCQECDCDQIGSESCDKDTGKCNCKANVVGDRCDQCAPDTWGFLSGNGCTSCNCSIASNSTQCDIVNGACECQPGVTGQLCDSCLSQHWDFTKEGCKSCACELDGAVGCSVTTGICQCLDGVTGEKCDRCENRWVLIPEKGCESCDSCVHTLLDDTDDLKSEIENASASLYIINIGVEAKKRLEELNKTAQNVREALENVPKRSLSSDEMNDLIGNLTALENLAYEALKEAKLTNSSIADATNFYKTLDANVTDINATKDDAFAEIQAILAYIQRKYQEIMDSEELRDVSRLLKEAEKMLQNMLDRQEILNELLASAENAEKNAKDTLNKVEQWNLESMDLLKRFTMISDILNDTNRRLLDLQMKAEDALAKAEASQMDMNSLEEVITALRENTAEIRLLKEILGDNIDKAEQYNVETNELIENSTAVFLQVERDLTILETMVDRLNTLYDTLSSGNVEARPKVDAAIAHADSLKVQATDLTNLLNETAQAAVKAANASRMIIASINEAMNASQEALDMAKEAVQQLNEGVCCGDSTDIHNNTEQVRADSMGLLEEAQLLKNNRSDELEERLRNSGSTRDGLEMKNSAIDQKYSEVDFNLNLINTDQVERAEEVRIIANKSQMKVMDAKEATDPIVGNLNGDMQLVNDIPSIQQQMSNRLERIRTKMETIRGVLPNVTNITESLMTLMPGLNASRVKLDGDIGALREQIDKARAIANRLKIAVKTNENTTIDIRVPDEFASTQAQQSELSLFFQTETENGLLMYVGPEAPSTLYRSKRAVSQTPEYMAIELVDGHVEFKYYLGGESARITSANTYNDNRWHQVIASRLGREGTLVVRTHNAANDEVTGEAGGSFKQLDLLPKNVRIFAGGVPDGFSLPSDVVNRRFVGALDEFSYSDTEKQMRLGLWNFNDGSTNLEGITNRGAELLPEISEIARFVSSSESYITIDPGTLSAQTRFSMTLKFRTLNKDGILFFMGQDMSKEVDQPDYFKLYMKDGKINAAIQLGAGEITVTIDQLYDDGEEHEVFVNRVDNQLYIKVGDDDDTMVGSDKSLVLNLGVYPELHFGGIPKDSQYYGLPLAAHDYFDGCIWDISLARQTKKILGSNTAKKGVLTGCKLVKRAVTFKEAPAGTKPTDDEGFVHILDVVTINENFTVGMRIKTVAENGTLFYASSQDDANAFSVTLVDGKIRVDNTAGIDGSGAQRKNQVTTKNKFNDGGWHSLEVTKAGLELTIAVDDRDITSETGTHRGKKTKTDPSFGYYFGGLRWETIEDIKSRDNSPTWQRFVGCMSDVYIKKETIDFAIFPPQGDYADYSTCSVPDPVDPDATTTLNLPMQDSTTTTTVVEPQSCKLPQQPNIQNVTEQGTRFGLDPDSRFEFTTMAGISDIRKELRLRNYLKFMVKTYASEGMMWFIGDERAKPDESPDYSAIYLDKGKVVYKCNLGGGSGGATSRKVINDGRWHSVEIRRERTQTESNKVVNGALIIDSEKPLDITWPGGSTALKFVLPVYVGGMNMDADSYVYMSEKLGFASTASLVGCIDQIEYLPKEDNAQWISYGEAKSFSTQGCFENQEDGVFIPLTGGAMALGDQTGIGVNAEVELSVRPRSLSGVLFLVWGGGDYFGIELFEGSVKVNVNNGAGDIEAQMLVADICDGQWRKIKVVKRANVVTLMVSLESEDYDEDMAQTGRGSSSSTSADTNSPVLIGGIPNDQAGYRYRPESSESYVGCIRSVTVSGKSFNMSRGKKYGDVARTCLTT